MAHLRDLVGTVRRFGLVGPRYEVIAELPPSPSGEPQVKIRLVESGEEASYPAKASLTDPVEA